VNIFPTIGALALVLGVLAAVVSASQRVGFAARTILARYFAKPS
jgi:hypothetical protein